LKFLHLSRQAFLSSCDPVEAGLKHLDEISIFRRFGLRLRFVSQTRTVALFIDEGKETMPIIILVFLWCKRFGHTINELLCHSNFVVIEGLILSRYGKPSLGGDFIGEVQEIKEEHTAFGLDDPEVFPFVENDLRDRHFSRTFQRFA
jgi:hypothetical protein